MRLVCSKPVPSETWWYRWEVSCAPCYFQTCIIALNIEQAFYKSLHCQIFKIGKKGVLYKCIEKKEAFSFGLDPVILQIKWNETLFTSGSLECMRYTRWSELQFYYTKSLIVGMIFTWACS